MSWRTDLGEAVSYLSADRHAFYSDQAEGGI
jgi:hypothetical protein